MATKQVTLGEIERGLLYLQGCLDIAKTRSTELSRDFDYVERKLKVAKPGLVSRGVFDALCQAISACRKHASDGDIVQADYALASAAVILNAASPQFQTPADRWH